MEKLSVKNGDYLRYLLIKNGYVNNGVDAEEEALRQVDEKRLKSATLTG
jgi:hypothetical protein